MGSHIGAQITLAEAHRVVAACQLRHARQLSAHTGYLQANPQWEPLIRKVCILASMVCHRMEREESGQRAAQDAHLRIDIAKVGAFHIGEAALPRSYAEHKDACVNTVGSRALDTKYNRPAVVMVCNLQDNTG